LVEQNHAVKTKVSQMLTKLQAMERSV